MSWVRVPDPVLKRNKEDDINIKNNYEIKDEYVIGYTSNRNEFYFDIDDFEKIKQYHWKLDSKHNVVACGIKPRLSMHKLIMGDGIYIHRNSLNNDNRKSNLFSSRWYKNEGYTFLNGYKALYMPEHPRAFENGCVYEHIIVAEKILRRPLNSEECVHHIDKNRLNNNESNLMVFATNKDHISFHSGGHAVLQVNGTYITEPMHPKYVYNNRTAKDIKNCIVDEGSIIILDNKYYDLCPICNEKLKSKDAKCCRKCYVKKKTSNIPNKEQLEQLIYEFSFKKIGDKYGVSDTAVKKWCRKYGLPCRKKDIKKENAYENTKRGSLSGQSIRSDDS